MKKKWNEEVWTYDEIDQAKQNQSSQALYLGRKMKRPTMNKAFEMENSVNSYSY